MKKVMKTGAFWLATVMLWEVTFHLVVWRGLAGVFLASLPFSLSLAVVFTAACHLWPWDAANRITAFVLLSVTALIFCVQTVYYRIFSTLLSLNLVGEGGQAIANFFGVMIEGIVKCLPFILIYLLPIPVLAVLYKKGVISPEKGGLRNEGVVVLAAVLFFVVGVPGRGSGSGRAEVYYDPTATIEDQSEYFGLLTGERLELRRLSSDETGLVSDVLDLTAGTTGTASALASSDGEEGLNIMEELDFDRLLEAAGDDEQLRELTEYFSGLRGTNKNEYTGMFEGFNVIQLCAESFCYYAVDPVLTPTLYKLSHEGIVFDNFYCSFSSTTTNGEYCLNMGVLPDFNRMSFNMSVDNLVPFTLGNRLSGVDGIVPRAYHNNTAYFYGRINSHPNMGYDFKAVEHGLELTKAKPYSDLEMFQKTMDDYIHDDRFLAYYMTYSGHHPYDFTGNSMAIKNQAEVAGLDAPDTIKAYFAANLELEHGLTYMLGRLEEEGLLDRTLIILTGDHYPYALSLEDHMTLAGDMVEEDPFWRYRGKFICWTGAIDEPIHVDAPCCTQDILPTVLNLLGIEYDSRLMTGTDVLSDSTHIAVLQEGGFRTKDLIYDMETDAVTYLTPEEDLPEGYFDKLREAVKNEFSVAASILRSDYYGFAFETLGLGERVDREITDATFSDTRDTWYMEYVNDLARLGVVRGTKLNFKGEEAVTRSDFAVMITRTLELPTPEVEGSPFTDLAETDWQYADIMGLYGAGVLEAGSCDPFGFVTLDEALTYVTRLADYYGEDPEEFREAVSYASETNAANGGTADPISRGSAAYVADTILGILERK